MQTCERCQDHRWVCMAHPDQPFSHADCTAGVACPACNTTDPPQRMPGFGGERTDPIGAAGDSGLPLHCPLCGARVVFVRSEEGTLYYRCFRDGELMLPSDGRIRQVPQ